MAEMFSSGRVVDLVLLLVALEAALLFAWHRRTGRGLPPAALVGFLGAGACLMLAVRAALTGAWWGTVGAWMAAAGAAHVFDLWWRSRRG